MLESRAATCATEMSKAHILLADDHTLVLEGIKKLLEPHFELAGTVEDGRALLDT